MGLQRIFFFKNLSLLWKWVGGSRSRTRPGLTRNFFGISSQNSSEPVLIFRSCIVWVYIMVVYTLLKFVGYYDLSVWLGVGGVSSIQVYLGFFLTLQRP